MKKVKRRALCNLRKSALSAVKQNFQIRAQHITIICNASSLSGQILDVDDYYECSRDCVSEQWSSMYIPGNTRTTEAGENTLVKMTSFYDNEMGYSSRMAELSMIFAAL